MREVVRNHQTLAALRECKADGVVRLKTLYELQYFLRCIKTSYTCGKYELVAVQEVGNLYVLYHMHPANGVFKALSAGYQFKIVFVCGAFTQLFKGYCHYASPRRQWVLFILLLMPMADMGQTSVQR